MTILENLSMADCKGGFFGLQRGTDKKRIPYYRELLSQLGLGLEDKLSVKVGTLSGGQRQAMSLLMSAMTPIDFLILDETYGGSGSKDGGSDHGVDRKDRKREKTDHYYGHS